MRRLTIVVTLLALLSASLGAAKAQAHPHPVLWHWYRSSGARCVHSHEGSWTDPGSPYYGGFQMDRSFMRYRAPGRYRVAGTADQWTPTHQVAVVRRAVRQIGWGPWPHTARICGLL